MLVKKTLKNLLYLMTGAQILLGLGWMFFQFEILPAFSMSEELMQMSRTWVIDEYTGVGYPVVLFFANLLESYFKIPFYQWVYVLQLGMAFFSGKFLLSKLFQEKGWKFKTIWGSFYIMSIPMIMQCHMAILPFSFTLSAIFFAIGFIIQIVNSEYFFKDFIFLGISIGISILFFPDIFWLYLFLSFLLGCYLFFQSKNWKKVVLFLLVAGFFLGSGKTVNVLVQEPGSLGKIQKSVSATLLGRVVWPYFDLDYYFWPWQVKDCVLQEEAWSISCYPERVSGVFGPAMEEKYGKKEASGFYMEMVQSCFNVRTRQIVGEIKRDFLAYTCPQISLLRQLKGDGVSLNAYNYKQMQRANPMLTKVYMKYFFASFVFLFILSIFLILYQRIKGKRTYRLCEKAGMIFILLSGMWQIIYCTLGTAGTMDYKNALFVVSIYGILILGGLESVRKKGETNGQKNG